MIKSKLLIISLFSASVFAQDSLYMKNGDVYSLPCLESCKPIQYEEFGYFEYNSIENLSWPYEDFFMLSMNSAAVNVCGAIYRYSKNDSKLSLVKNINKKTPQICNLTQLNEMLISKEKHSALISHEIAFKIKDSLLTEVFDDEIYAGESINRSIGNDLFLVGNQKNPLSRNKLIAQITSERAYFYNENFEKTKNYLVKGDEPEPLYLKYNEKGDWVKIKFNKFNVFIEKKNVRFFSEFYK